MTEEIIRLAHKLIAGTRKNLAEQAKVSIRTIDNWKSGDRTVRLEELFHLLEGAEGAAFFQAFWDQVPEATRERWIKSEMLRRRLAERALERDREDREIEQLRMELSRR
jgi:transcriptional regulator with XRE-family HTH domain